MLPSQAARPARRDDRSRPNAMLRRVARWAFLVILAAAGVCAAWLLAAGDPESEGPGQPLAPALSPALARTPAAEPAAPEGGAAPAAEPASPAPPPAAVVAAPEPAIQLIPDAPAPVAAAPPAPPASPAARELLARGMELVAANRPLEARRAYNGALAGGALSEPEAAEVRRTLAELNERLVFSPEVVPGDPFAFGYLVQDGDSLARITRRLGLHVDYRLLQRVNRMADPGALRAGRNLKIVTGPFHAIIDKAAMRMDIYMGEESDLVYLRSFPVGLGQHDSTPVGRFRVRPQSKLVNPQWVCPRTRQRFDADDPANPIGERWIGLEGTDEATSGFEGYGIHGTIEPDSIGRQASMGCVRMLHEDVEIVYELLTEGTSAVRIVAGRS
jgi:hypothetical protein